jgi:hypothetical protein
MKKIFAAAVSVFAIAALSQSALAEEAHAVDARALLEQVFAAAEESRADASKFVLATAEARMAERMAEIDARKEKPAASFMVASN